MVDGFNVLHIGFIGHVDGFGDGAGEEGLGSRHDAEMALEGNEPHAFLSTFIGAIENRVMFFFQLGRLFDGHGAAAVLVGLLDFLVREAEMLQQIKVPCVHGLLVHMQVLSEEPIAQGIPIKREFDIERGSERGFHLVQHLLRKPLCFKGFVVNARSAF